MKKLTTALFSILIASSTFLSTAQAATLNMTVNNKAVSFQYGTPFIDSGSSLVPLRDLLVALGVSNNDDHIQWNSREQSVTIVKDSKTVKLSVGSNQIFLDGALFKQLEVPAKNVDGRVYLPARAVAEALGFFVGYDTETSTVLVQEVPFGGGVKADDYSDDAEQRASIPALGKLKIALSSYGVELPQASERTISENAETFFSASKDPLSLDKVAKWISPEEIVKRVSSHQSSIVNLTSLQLDSIREIPLEDGTVLTGAVGHTGGKFSSLTNTWEDETYFQIFFVGNTKAVKGDNVTVNGIPIGETTIELMDAKGQAFVEPMVILAAGNLIKTSEEYDLRIERSKGGKIDWTAFDQETQERINHLLLVTLNNEGLQINDRTYTHGLEITKVKINDYEYTPTSKTDLPTGSLNIPLSSFKDANGTSLAKQSGSFFVFITTNYGEFFKFVDFE